MGTTSALPAQQCQGQAFLLRLSFLADACLCALACILTDDMVLCMHDRTCVHHTVARPFICTAIATTVLDVFQPKLAATSAL